MVRIVYVRVFERKAVENQKRRKSLPEDGGAVPRVDLINGRNSITPFAECFVLDVHEVHDCS